MKIIIMPLINWIKRHSTHLVLGFALLFISCVTDQIVQEKAATGSIFHVILNFFKSYKTLIWLVFFCFVVDFISAIYAALKCKDEVSSKRMRFGFPLKAVELIILFIFCWQDKSAGLNIGPPMYLVVSNFIIAAEALSICENFSKAHPSSWFRKFTNLLNQKLDCDSDS